MNGALGIGLIVGGGALALVSAIVLRARVPAPVGIGSLALCGVAIGTGALLVQDHVTAADWGVALPFLAVTVPAHVRIVLGPFGPSPRAAPPRSAETP